MHIAPPVAPKGHPVEDSLVVGDLLYRVHKSEYDGDSYNPTLSHRYFAGGRFDPTVDDPYGQIYAARRVETVLAETLLADVEPDHRYGIRLPATKYIGRSLSVLQVNQPLRLVSLRTAPALSALGQDSWLTQIDWSQYAQTRHWGHWIREVAPWCMGFVWMSRRDPAHEAYILFQARAPTGAISCAKECETDSARVDFSTPSGRVELRSRLEPFGVEIVL